MQKFVHAQAGRFDEPAQRSRGKLVVLRHGEIRTNVSFGQDEMASHLTTHLPTSPLKGLRRIFPRDVRQLTHDAAFHARIGVLQFLFLH